MITDLKSLYVEARKNSKKRSGLNGANYEFSDFNTQIFCNMCGDYRTSSITGVINVFSLMQDKIKHYPIVLKATCLQCGRTNTLIIYQPPGAIEKILQLRKEKLVKEIKSAENKLSNQDTEKVEESSQSEILDEEKFEDLIILSDSFNNKYSKFLPQEVQYYLGQAIRSQTIGAKSAAAGMYRAALEMMLFKVGYIDGMLNKKISNLESDIEKNNTNNKEWIKDIDLDFLKAIKDIGNGSMHSNDGNISKQELIDDDLLKKVDAVFAHLIDIIYERSARLKEQKQALLAVTKALK